MHRGYIKLWRNFREHPFWKEKREFSKAEAWEDILYEAQYTKTPRLVPVGLAIMTCNYSESLKTLGEWADRWSWSKSRVRRFLKLCEQLIMIRYENESNAVRITVLNFELYNPTRNGDETQTERKRNENETQTKRPFKGSKKEKKVKKVKKEKVPPLSPQGEDRNSWQSEYVVPDRLNNPEFLDKFGEWLNYRVRILRIKPYAPATIRRKLLELAEIGCSQAIAAMDFSMSNQYQGLFYHGSKQGSKQGTAPAAPDDDDDEQYSNIGSVIDVS